MINFGTPEMLIVSILALPVLYIGFRQDSKYKKVVGSTRALFFVLLALALASPSITVHEQRFQRAEAVILEDRSRSTSIMSETNLDLEGIKVERKTVASGNSSDLKSGLLQNVEENRVYLLKSDLQSSSNLEGVAKKIQRKNATVHVLKPEMKEEVSVAVKGPETTYPGVKNTFTVEVESTGKNVTPEVTVNGEKAELEKKAERKWSFSRTFEEQGHNTIKASVEIEDHIEANNRYFKAVEVSEKPEILVLGDEGRIAQEFSDFYSFSSREEIPEDLDKYYAVIAKKNFPEASLSSFIAEGNGLIYTGDYEEENQILPVQKIPAEQQSQGARIIFAIDTSFNSGNCEYYDGPDADPFENDIRCGGGGEVKRAVSIAASLMTSLYERRQKGNIGAVAYNNSAWKISNPKPLTKQHRDNLIDKLSRLKSRGLSFHHRGIEGAKKMIGEKEGNIVLITDGGIGGANEANDVPRKTLEAASSLDSKLFIIGVGSGINEEADFFEKVARRGNGEFFNFNRSEGIKTIPLQEGGTDDSGQQIVVFNRDHFITRNLQVSSTLGSFDPVETKPGAKTLVTATGGQPFLSTWRYGIGRVAAFSGGEKDLGATIFRDSKLVSRTLSWAVGDPKRKKDRWVDVENGQKGEKVEVRSSFKIKGLNQQGENLYTGTLEPKKTGFHRFNSTLYSYNYNDEVEDIGYGELESFAGKTGGKVFNPTEEKEISEAVKSFSSEKISKSKKLSDFFLAAALLVFLGEIGFRKRKGKK